MTENELRAAFSEYDPLAATIGWLEDDGETLVENGVAVLLGTNLDAKWQADDFIVFWQSGDVTALPDGFAFFNLVY